MPSPLHRAVVETYNDHRIAMAFAVTDLKVTVGGSRIRDCVAKTYSGFSSIWRVWRDRYVLFSSALLKSE